MVECSCSCEEGACAHPGSLICRHRPVLCVGQGCVQTPQGVPLVDQIHPLGEDFGDDGDDEGLFE